MLNFDLYAIYTDDNERNGSIKEFFHSFEEAKKNRFKYANWFCPKGNIWISKYKAGTTFHPCYEWHIHEDGHIMSEYDWSKNYKDLR